MEPKCEAELLLEIARLYAALIRVIRDIDDPKLKAELADLIWPPAPPPPAKDSMFNKLSSVRKAITGAILAGGPLALAALQDQSPGGSDLVRSELIAVVVTAVVAGAGVYSVPNEPRH